jgi:hypothetical protein
MNEEKLNQLIEKIEHLEQRINQMSTPTVLQNNRFANQENTLSDKLMSRQILLEKITTLYPGLMVTIAKRQDGGGLLLINRHDNQSYRVKCYYSRNYSKDRLFGWFSIRTIDLYETPYDFYAMSLDFNQNNHLFLFSQKQILDIMKEKKLLRDKNKPTDQLEHFYIEDNKGVFYETREIDKNLDQYRGTVNGGIDVSYGYQNYDLFQDVIGEIKEVSNKPFTTNDVAFIKNKIHEVLNNQFVVPLEKRDFYHKSNLYQYIEMGLQDNKLSELKSDFDNIKSVVIHIRAHSYTPLSVIHSTMLEVENLFNVSVITGVTIDNQRTTQTQIFVLGNKEVL